MTSDWNKKMMIYYLRRKLLKFSNTFHFDAILFFSFFSGYLLWRVLLWSQHCKFAVRSRWERATFSESCDPTPKTSPEGDDLGVHVPRRYGSDPSCGGLYELFTVSGGSTKPLDTSNEPRGGHLPAGLSSLPHIASSQAIFPWTLNQRATVAWELTGYESHRNHLGGPEAKTSTDHLHNQGSPHQHVIGQHNARHRIQTSNRRNMQKTNRKHAGESEGAQESERRTYSILITQNV